MTTLAVIPARGGSKGIPGKNITPVAGRPLIAWTIEAALAARGVDRVVVSTDDPEIARVARETGAEVPFMRPSGLASDDAQTMDVMIHAIEALVPAPPPSDHVTLCLQPTSPLRTAGDIESALARFESPDVDAVVSVTPADPHPLWTKELDDAGHLRPFIPDRPIPPRRQELPPAYALNGAVYAARTPWLLAHRSWYGSTTVAYIMPPERSADVDTPWDLTLATLILKARSGR